MELQARLATLQAEQAALPRQVAQLEARLAAEREQLQRQQASEQQGLVKFRQPLGYILNQL